MYIPGNKAHAMHVQRVGIVIIKITMSSEYNYAYYKVVSKLQTQSMCEQKKLLQTVYNTVCHPFISDPEYHNILHQMP